MLVRILAIDSEPPEAIVDTLAESRSGVELTGAEECSLEVPLNGDTGISGCSDCD